MSRGMVSFLAGLGSGYIKAKDKAYDRERQEKEDAWRDEQREWQRSDRSRQEGDRQAVADAFAPRTTMQGTVVEGGGNRTLTQDPQQALAVQKMQADVAELEGSQAPVVQPGTAVTGQMSRGHQITDGPVDLEKLNSRDAQFGRASEALMQRGQVERAVSMENAAMDNRLKRMGLDRAQAEAADKMFNDNLLGALQRGPNWWEGAARVLNDTQVGSLAGVNVQARVSGDGKTVDFVATKDGKEQVVKSMPADEQGMRQFIQSAARVPLEAKIGFLKEAADRQYREGRDAVADSQWQQTFDYNKQKGEDDKQYRQRLLGFQASQESRAQALHKIAMEDAKIPPAVKLNAQALADQIKSVDAALNKSMAEGMFNPDNIGTQKLQEQRAALSLQYRRLLDPYIPGAQGQQADPLGLSGTQQPRPAAPGAPAPAPASTNNAARATAPNAADPLAGKSRADLRKMQQTLQAEKDRYIKSGQQTQASQRIREIDGLMSRIVNGQY